jgi:ergothioneine biosynthesis protein EgtB
MQTLLDKQGSLKDDLIERIILGLNHEQQHQELLVYDIKYILGNNPLFPELDITLPGQITKEDTSRTSVQLDSGIYTIGYQGSHFYFDNEQPVHEVLLQQQELQSSLVTNADILEFIEAGCYKDFKYWLDEGWSWVEEHRIQAPEYWQRQDGGKWLHYRLNQGLIPVDEQEPLMHISFYEADALARFKGKDLPTEFEWEAASRYFEWGFCWEWTNSAYLPYPRFEKAPGALGEYNGKFMVNQMVLRGASPATSPGHSRRTYRNFFHPHLQWQYAGIRLAK